MLGVRHAGARVCALLLLVLTTPLLQSCAVEGAVRPDTAAPSAVPPGEPAQPPVAPTVTSRPVPLPPPIVHLSEPVTPAPTPVPVASPPPAIIPPAPLPPPHNGMWAGPAPAAAGESNLDTYKVEIGAPARLTLPGNAGVLLVWIGAPDHAADIPVDWAHDAATAPAEGAATARVKPFVADGFSVDPAEGICMAITPAGSTVRFRLTPQKTGTFDVSADVRLYRSADCSGAAVSRPTRTLHVQVVVDRKGWWEEHLGELGAVFWDKFLAFWGWAVGAFFAILAFLIRKRVKRWLGLELKTPGAD